MTSPPAGWLWASQCTAALPLILAGPIVRRVDPQSASVWVATRSATAVKLDVFAQGAQIGTGSTNTVKLGDNLHVAVVTARPSSGVLQPGVLYTYQLTFGATSFAAALGGQTALNDICNQVGATATLPSFVLPPQNLSGVRIVHASCLSENARRQPRRAADPRRSVARRAQRGQ